MSLRIHIHLLLEKVRKPGSLKTFAFQGKELANQWLKTWAEEDEWYNLRLVPVAVDKGVKEWHPVAVMAEVAARLVEEPVPGVASRADLAVGHTECRPCYPPLMEGLPRKETPYQLKLNGMIKNEITRTAAEILFVSPIKLSVKPDKSVYSTLALPIRCEFILHLLLAFYLRCICWNHTRCSILTLQVYHNQSLHF